MNRVRVRKTENGKYFYDVWYGKKRYRKITNLGRIETEKAGQKLLKDLDRLKHGIQDEESVEPVLFEKFADEFIEKHSKLNKRPASVRSDENSLVHLKSFFKNRYLAGIRPELVEAYKAERIKAVSPASVNRELALLKAIMNKALEWRRISANAIAGRAVKKFPEPLKKERILTKDEAGHLLENASVDIKPFLIIALNTGMRRNEILTLKWDDLDFLNREVRVRAEISKSKKLRWVPMNDVVRDTIKALTKRSSFVFFNTTTGENIKDIKTAFRTACRRAKIKGFRVHDLRHTAATWMIEAGADIMTLKEILGHASVETTMRYCHPSKESKQRAVVKLGEAFEKALTLGKKVDTSSEIRKVNIPVSSSYTYD